MLPTPMTERVIAMPTGNRQGRGDSAEDDAVGEGEDQDQDRARNRG